MKNIFVNGVRVGSLSESDLESLKEQAYSMRNRWTQQAHNLAFCLATMLRESLSIAPLLTLALVFFSLFVMPPSGLITDGLINVNELTGLLLGATVASYMTSLLLVAISPIFIKHRFGYKNVAQEEFYRLLRIKLGVAAEGKVTCADSSLSDARHVK